MSTAPHDPQLVRAVERIKHICAPPPENDMRGNRRRIFEQSHFMRQEDSLYVFLRKEGTDPKYFCLLTAAAVHYTREAQLQRLKSRSAFCGRWAYRNPKRATAKILDDLDFLRSERDRLAGAIQSALAIGNCAAHIALSRVDDSAALGVRLAALVELADRDAAPNSKFAALIQLVDEKTRDKEFQP